MVRARDNAGKTAFRNYLHQRQNFQLAITTTTASNDGGVERRNYNGCVSSAFGTGAKPSLVALGRLSGRTRFKRAVRTAAITRRNLRQDRLVHVHVTATDASNPQQSAQTQYPIKVHAPDSRSERRPALDSDGVETTDAQVFASSTP